jgi:hypothetical protein
MNARAETYRLTRSINSFHIGDILWTHLLVRIILQEDLDHLSVRSVVAEAGYDTSALRTSNIVLKSLYDTRACETLELPHAFVAMF